MRRWIAIGAVAAATLVAAGCGGDDTSDTPAAAEWAGGVCTALTTWKDEVSGAAESLQDGNLSADALKSAVGDVGDATRTLSDDLKGLGRPDTEAGQEAQETLASLADELATEADTIESAVEDASGISEILTAVSTISSTFVTMGQQVSSAFSSLEDLEGGQELKDAFTESESCSSLAGGS
jgi:hypothetical protein